MALMARCRCGGTDGKPGRRFKRPSTPPASTPGYPETYDHNHPDSGGIGPFPMNNPNGVRMSTALSYINPNRHRLNLTIRGNVHVRRILFQGQRASGVEVESGGEVFTVEADEIVLSAGAIASPQLLMLSGVGPEDHLRSLGIPVVRALPGVGQNLRDHPLVPIRMAAKPDFPQDPNGPRIQTVLRYTSGGSDSRNDMQIFPSSFSTPLGGDPFRQRRREDDLHVGAGGWVR